MFFNYKNTLYLYTYENGIKTSLAGCIQFSSQGRGYCVELHVNRANRMMSGAYSIILITKEKEISCGLIRMNRGVIDEKHYLPVHDNAFYIKNTKVNCDLVEGIKIRVDSAIEIAGYFSKTQRKPPVQFPMVNPFGDEQKFFVIKPKDCEILEGNGKELVHNSFLLHGFYNYRHLILGPYVIDDNSNNTCCILGVPGTFYQRELAVARMFGFEQFACKGIQEPAKFGYYTKEVALQKNMIYK